MNSISYTTPVLPDTEAQPLVLPVGRVTVRAGFPSPADDFVVERLDIMKLLVRHPQSTYFWKVKGDSMQEAGIHDDSIVAVDRSIRPRSGQIVLALVDGEATVKYLQVRAGRTRLRAANPTYPDIVPKDGQTLEVWGVVLGAVKTFPV